MKKHIKKLYERDRRALVAIGRCGYITKEQLLTIVKEKRIYNYQKDKIIQNEKYYHSENGFEGYKLTKSGKKLIEKEWGFNKFQQAQTLWHDSIISNKYFSLTEEERETWKTETEVQAMLKEIEDNIDSNEKYSALDAIYTNQDGIDIGFEAVTCNYTVSDIQAKVRVANALQVRYEEGRR